MWWRHNACCSFRLRNCPARSLWSLHPGDAPASSSGRAAGFERVRCLLEAHAVGDGVAHDPVRPHVLDRAEVDLALARRVFGDIGSTTGDAVLLP